MANLGLSTVNNNGNGTDGTTYLKNCYFQPTTGNFYNFCNPQGTVLASNVNGSAGSFSFSGYPNSTSRNWTWTITISPPGLNSASGGSGSWTNTDPNNERLKNDEDGSWQATATPPLEEAGYGEPPD